MGTSELIIVVVLWALPLGLVIHAITGNRPKPARFFSVNGLETRAADIEHVRIALRRTSMFRVIGAIVGATLAGFAARDFGIAGTVAAVGIGSLAGSMLGITLSQFRRHRPISSARTASLTVRDIRDYVPSHASITIDVLAVLVIGYAVFAMATAAGPLRPALVLFIVGLSTIVVVPIGRAFQHRTVELRRHDVDTASVRVDDALRASALRGIHHATLGVLMCGLLLVGYAAVAVQNVTTVKVGDRTVLRLESVSTIAVPEPLVVEPPQMYRLDWTEFTGRSHSRVLHTGGQRVTLGSLHVSVLMDSGYWVALIALLGALIEWSRAAKAWRRPQRTPSLVAPIAALGMA